MTAAMADVSGLLWSTSSIVGREKPVAWVGDVYENATSSVQSVWKADGSEWRSVSATLNESTKVDLPPMTDVLERQCRNW